VNLITTSTLAATNGSGTAISPLVFSLIGVLLGSAIARVGNWIVANARIKGERESTDTRISAEREARQSDTAERRNEIRRQFQRETLIALQDSLAAFLRSVGEGLHHDVMHHHTTGEAWGSSLWGEERSNRFTACLAEALKLTARVEDENLRTILLQLRSTASSITGKKSKQEAEATMLRAMELYEATVNRIGEVFRLT
jgi:hypothetical protein